MRSKNIKNHGHHNRDPNIRIPKYIKILICSVEKILVFKPENRNKYPNIHDHQIGEPGIYVICEKFND